MWLPRIVLFGAKNCIRLCETSQSAIANALSVCETSQSAVANALPVCETSQSAIANALPVCKASQSAVANALPVCEASQSAIANALPVLYVSLLLMQFFVFIFDDDERQPQSGTHTACLAMEGLGFWFPFIEVQK